MAGLMLCLVFNTLNSTVPRYHGTVKDDSGAPVEFATVTLVTLNDSTLIDGTVTDENGMFSLTGQATPLFLRVSAMGFEEKTIDYPTPDVGEIRLETASYMLGEVAVNGSRPVARLKGNGVEVAISGTYLANTGTALDLLGKMPFVSKSGSEIEVLGKGTPLVYINGREVRDQSELDRLASSQIKNVEVITTPGRDMPHRSILSYGLPPSRRSGKGSRSMTAQPQATSAIYICSSRPISITAEMASTSSGCSTMRTIANGRSSPTRQPGISTPPP